MGLLWTRKQHDTPGSVGFERDYDLIERAGAVAREAVMAESVAKLAEAVLMSYSAQLGEKMEELPEILGSVARKYCGGGHGGYALYLFSSQEARDAAPGLVAVEPYYS
jgi:hypothetical protein